MAHTYTWVSIIGRKNTTMINEKIEVENYLAGENIYKNECTFRMCYLMAKYYRDQGLSPVEIRKKIFAWGHEYGVYITHNVNDMIRMAITKNEPLCVANVYINNDDIKEISDRFSKKNTKMCALAFLLLAKVHSDKDGMLTFNQTDFSKWVGILQPNVSNIFDELEFFDYIERIKMGDNNTFIWNGKVIGKNVKYKLKVPCVNSGEYILKDNKIRELYDEIFSKKNKSVV